MASSAHLLAALYLALPVVAVVWAVARARRTRSRRPVVGLAATAVTAAVVAAGVNGFHAWLAGAGVRADQVGVTFYLAVGVLSMFRAIGWGLREGIDRLFRVRTLDGRLALGPTAAPGEAAGPAEPAEPPADADGPPSASPMAFPSRPGYASGRSAVGVGSPGRPGGGWVARAALASVARGLLLFGLSMVYVLAVGMVYRPKLSADAGRPDLACDPVTFRSTDGVRLAGWWMPAAPPPSTPAATPSPLGPPATKPATRPAGGGEVVSASPAGSARLADPTAPVVAAGVLSPAAVGSPPSLPPGVGAATRPVTKPAAAEVPSATATATTTTAPAATRDTAATVDPYAPAAGPGTAPSPTPPADLWGRRTVVLCHGLGKTKAAMLPLARDLVAHGYNVLAFDFRAVGESDGVLTGMGAAERADVLGAVRWVRKNRPAAAGHLFGVGSDVGAAALTAAAADPSPDGQAIAAVALFGVYRDLPAWADERAGGAVPKPIAWVARRLSAPLAGLHVGADLAAFSPAALVDRVAPRPVLVVHGHADELVPFDQGLAVYEAASQPKLRFWVGEQDEQRQWVVRTNPRFGAPDALGRSTPRTPEGPPADRARTLADEDAARAVRMFFEMVLPEV